MEAPAPEKFFRVTAQIPGGWGESLSWILEKEGYGTNMEVRGFPSGLLSGEPIPAAERETMVLLVDPSRRDSLSNRMEELAQLWKWESLSWDLKFEEREDQDWEALWRARWKPFRCGRFVIYPHFAQVNKLPLRERDIPLQMVAGSSFGTGGHSSTRMALRSLLRWWEEAPFRSLLDLGTGSGILGISAAVLGVDRVAGMDIDPASAPQATKTAQANKVGGRCSFWRGSLESAAGEWEVVMGNLQSDILRHYAPLISKRLCPGGRFFAGGILDLKAKKTIDSLKAAELVLLKTQLRGRWCTAEFQKK